jgi:hypothetical protein
LSLYINDDVLFLTFPLSKEEKEEEMKIVKTVMTAVAVLTLMMLTGPTAQATTVYPANDPTIDLPAVQAAVSAGGRVLLKATNESGDPTAFDFGPGTVVITSDVQICGERDEDGLPMTTISGGFWSFYSPLPLPADPTDWPDFFLNGPSTPGPRITIKNLHFDGAMWVPILISYTSGVKIKNNRITNVLPFPITLFGPEDFWQHGICVLSLLDDPRGELAAVVPNTITGRIVVKNNEIDLQVPPISPYNPQTTMSQGVFVVYSWGADIRIKGNIVREVTRNSIEVLNNYKDDDGKGSVRIKENTIVTAEEGIPFPSYNYPNGIVAGWVFDPGASLERTPEFSIKENYVEGRGETSAGIYMVEAAATVKENEIIVQDGWEVDSGASGIIIVGEWAANSVVCENEITINPSTTGTPGLAGSGILILSDYTTVKENEITFDDPSVAVGILQLASEGMIRSNQIEGWGLAGVLLHPFPPLLLTAENNMIRANDFEDFDPAMADVVFASDPFGLGLTANYNTLVGDEDTTVIDEGIGNVIRLDDND